MSKIEDDVCNKIQQRSKIGEQKYKTTMERNDLKFIDWMIHLQEELMDASIYIEKIIQEQSKNRSTQHYHVKNKKNELILDTLHDSISDFLFYDRKEDEGLSEGDLKDAIKNGDVTIDEMVEYFKNELTTYIDTNTPTAPTITDLEYKTKETR